MTFGADLKALRDRASLRQRDVADSVGLSISYISALESGDRAASGLSRCTVDAFAVLLCDVGRTLLLAWLAVKIESCLLKGETLLIVPGSIVLLSPKASS